VVELSLRHRIVRGLIPSAIAGTGSRCYETICRVPLQIAQHLVMQEIQAQNNFPWQFMLSYKSMHGMNFILLSFPA
jgi:hypothetical protein